MSKRQLHPTKNKPWFCFDGDESEYFATEKEALEASKEAIQYYLNECWDEQVETVQVGKTTHISTKANITERPDTCDEEGVAGDGEYWPYECEFKCDYEAIPL